jgi:hypothetical protein
MSLRFSRRAVLLLPLMLAACGDDDEVPAPVVRRDFPPLRYGYLPPINLNVQRVQTAGGFVPGSGDNELIGASPVDPVATLFAMARDRLKPVGTGGTATFRVLNASIIRRRDELNGELAVRIDVRNDDDTSTGFAEARVTAKHTGPITDQRAVLYDMMKSMMENMNVELEYQLRNKLRSWVVDTPADVAPAAQPAKSPPSSAVTPPPSSAPPPADAPSEPLPPVPPPAPPPTE